MRVPSPWPGLMAVIQQLLTDPICMVCGEQLSSTKPLCPSCDSFFADLGTNRSTLTGTVLGITSLGYYRGSLKECVLALKRGGDPRLLDLVSDHLSEAIRATSVAVDVTTWIPGSKQRVRRNGFDHGKRLAGAVAGRISVPVLGCLRRADKGPSQHELGLEDRWAMTQERFSVNNRTTNLLHGKDVLLIDDVVTTGASAAEAVEALMDAGAASVHTAVIAVTPRRHPPPR